IDITVAGRSYAIAAREGDELHIRHLETILGRHADTALRASGGLNAERTLVYLALILADLLDETERNPP
ncbi:cell division protein ZapA, partial [Klebsiella pneumoniae]